MYINENYLFTQESWGVLAFTYYLGSDTGSNVSFEKFWEFV